MKNIKFQIEIIIIKIKNFLKLIIINLLFIRMKILAFIYFIITSIIYILTNKNILKININLIKHKIINKCNNLKLYILNIFNYLITKSPYSLVGLK